MKSYGPREGHPGFKVRHFYHVARRDHGVGLSYSFVKKALQTAGLVAKRRPRGRHRRRREPRPCFGELLHLDGSRHAWLALVPQTLPTLITVVDDATKRLLYAQLTEEGESAEVIMTALRAVLARHGIPGAVYTDRAGWAVYTPTSGTAPDRTKLTQVGRALAKLGVEHIVSFSPQARGRVSARERHAARPAGQRAAGGEGSGRSRSPIATCASSSSPTTTRRSGGRRPTAPAPPRKCFVVQSRALRSPTTHPNAWRTPKAWRTSWQRSHVSTDLVVPRVRRERR
jgi:hypothetical protein